MYLEVKKAESVAEKELKQAFDAAFMPIQDSFAVEHDQQRKLHNGIVTMKRKIKTLVGTHSLRDFLSSDGVSADMIAFANKELSPLDKQLEEAYKLIVVANGADVKSDADKQAMILTRINHYTKLHEKKVERDLLRRIRAAKVTKDFETYDKLTKQWESNYGTGK